MRRKFKGVLAALMAGIMCVSLAACGGGGSGGSEGKGKTEGDGEKVSLNLYIPQSHFKEQWDTFIERFVEYERTEKNREVEIQLEMPNEDENKQVLRARLASDDAPDVFKARSGTEVPEYYQLGYLADLSDQPFADELLPDVKNSVMIDDKVVAAPVEVQLWGYMYNKKLFEKYNLEIPKTYAQMQKTAETFKNNGVNPFVVSYNTAYLTRLYLQVICSVVQNTEINDWGERMAKDEGSFAEMKEQIFDIIDLVNSNGNENALEMDVDAGAAAFVNGEGAKR